MARRKRAKEREVRRVEDTNNLHVCFLKRGSGLQKKAFNLSVLCDAEVALIVFSTKGELCEFSSSRFGSGVPFGRFEMVQVKVASVPIKEYSAWPPATRTI